MRADDRTPLWSKDDEPPAQTATRGYRREPAAMDDLRSLTHVRPRDIPSMVASMTPEASVTALRACHDRGLEAIMWAVMEGLNVRIAGYVRRVLGSLPWSSTAEREDAERELALMLMTEWPSGAPQHEFWEARFWHCLSLRVVDAARLARRGTGHGGMLPVPLNAEAETADIAQQGPDPETTAIAGALLAGLPKDLRRVFLLKHYVGWTEEEIARSIGRTSRTVRNMLVRARGLLDAGACVPERAASRSHEEMLS